MYFYAVSTLNLNSVTHKFLIRGHTQNEGDNAHSLIEKSIKRAKKSGPIYVPSQYVQIIRNAKKTGNTFKVEELNYDDFIDLKVLTEEIGMNTTKTIDGNTMKLTDVKMIRFLKNSDTYEYKTTYDEKNAWTKVLIKPKTMSGRKSCRTRRDVTIQNVTLKPAYLSKLPIAEQKKKDLLYLIEKHVVPAQYKYFYDSIM